MSIALVIGLGIACTAGSAYAERAIAVDVAATAPFDAEELRHAMRVRLAADGEPVHVRVTVTATGLEVRVHDSAAGRPIDIAGLHGPAAARLVALAASDLLLDDLASIPDPQRRRRLTLGVLGGAAVWDSPLGGGAVDATVELGAKLLAVELGVARLLDHGELAMTTATMRIGGGMRAGIVEARAGLALAPVFVARGTGDRTLLVGAGASLRVRVPVASRVRAVFGGGADVFATQTEYRAGARTMMTTPRVAPWIGAGIEVTP